MRRLGKMIALITLILSAMALVACTSSKAKEEAAKQAAKEAEYRVEIVGAQKMILGSAAEALDVAESTRQKWSKAIDRHSSNWQYWFDEDMKELEPKKKLLGEYKTLTDKRMTDLQDPPEKYKAIHETVKEMYLTYGEINRQAIDPSGSLVSYGQEVNKLSSELLRLAEKAKIELPSEETKTK